jgi:hypothetical protein
MAKPDPTDKLLDELVAGKTRPSQASFPRGGRQPEICALVTYRELTRTPRMQERLLAIGLARRPISEREKLRNEIARLAPRYDRAVLYNQVWAQPVQVVARSYGLSGVALAKACRKLHVPVPPPERVNMSETVSGS